MRVDVAAVEDDDAVVANRDLDSFSGCVLDDSADLGRLDARRPGTEQAVGRRLVLPPLRMGLQLVTVGVERDNAYACRERFRVRARKRVEVVHDRGRRELLAAAVDQRHRLGLVDGDPVDAQVLRLRVAARVHPDRGVFVL